MDVPTHSLLSGRAKEIKTSDFQSEYQEDGAEGARDTFRASCHETRSKA